MFSNFPLPNKEKGRKQRKATYFGSIEQAQQMHQEWIKIIDRDGRVIGTVSPNEYREKGMKGYCR